MGSVPDADSYDPLENVVWRVKYVDNQTHIMCVRTGGTTMVCDSVIKGAPLYHMMRTPNAKDLAEEDAKREVKEGQKRKSLQEHINADKASHAQQAKENFLRAYVDEDAQRKVQGGQQAMSLQQLIDADKASHAQQAEENFLREYVAKHPDVYSRLEESERLNKDTMHTIFLGLDEISYRHVPAGEYLDDRIEALIAQDPDTLRYMADLEVQQDLRAENSATRRKIDKDILKKMDGAKGSI